MLGPGNSKEDILLFYVIIIGNIYEELTTCEGRRRYCKHLFVSDEADNILILQMRKLKRREVKQYV